ncbi:MAG: hypothetical protein AAFQ82_20160 [Myxococcota bacterium]
MVNAHQLSGRERVFFAVKIQLYLAGAAVSWVLLLLLFHRDLRLRALFDWAREHLSTLQFTVLAFGLLALTQWSLDRFSAKRWALLIFPVNVSVNAVASYAYMRAFSLPESHFEAFFKAVPLFLALTLLPLFGKALLAGLLQRVQRKITVAFGAVAMTAWVFVFLFMENIERAGFAGVVLVGIAAVLWWTDLSFEKTCSGRSYFFLCGLETDQAPAGASLWLIRLAMIMTLFFRTLPTVVEFGR